MASTRSNPNEKGGAGQMMLLIRWYGLLVFLIASLLAMTASFIVTLL